MSGDFAAGWKAYESRWHCDLPGFDVRASGFPEWRGEDGEGAVLVWGEQGLGDKVLYSSMIPDLMALGHKVVMETDERLIGLLERSFPGVRAVPKRNPPDEATQRSDIRWQSALASLGRWLRPDLASFPQRVSYLVADESRKNRYRAHLAATGIASPVVGISWISQNPNIGLHKTLDLKQWTPILQIPNVRFVNLQYGDTALERAEVEARLGVRIEQIPDLNLYDDIDGVAALAASCDMVISVSNTTAHLAAALGKPTWVLVPASVGNLWYWMRGTSQTPWYPTATIFRQPKIGQWSSVIIEIEKRLQSHLTHRYQFTLI